MTRPFAFLAVAGWVFLCGDAYANVIFVTTTVDKISGSGGCSLKEAIFSANLDSNVAPTAAGPVVTGCVPGSGPDQIVLPVSAVFQLQAVTYDPDNPFGPTATPMITSIVTIHGNGSEIAAATGLVARAFAVSSIGDLTLRDAYIRKFTARGGRGRDGGGGGLGAGGAIFVKGSGRLRLERCTLSENFAQGGNGSLHPSDDQTDIRSSGGGGGGMGGNGGPGGRCDSDHCPGGGGGGGSGADGAGPYAVGSIPAGGGGGGGGTVSAGHVAVDGQGGAGGERCGGFGGEVNKNGYNAPCAGGGGGGGGWARDLFAESNGANGNYGGGGGGAGFEAGENGGHGGFGGGGGAATRDDLLGSDGGDGGFGGGGGAGFQVPFFGVGRNGEGGYFAGDSVQEISAGGAGLGGAIFNDGGTLVIRNCTLITNRAQGGRYGIVGGDFSEGAGGAIFSRHGSTTVLNTTMANNRTSGGIGGALAIWIEEPVQSTYLTLHNTIIAGNVFSLETSGYGYVNDDLEFISYGDGECSIALAESARSLTSSSTGSGNLIVNNSGCPGVVSSANPQLAAPDLNSGLTPTMAIPVTSPAIDAGDPATALSPDQRGVDRPQRFGHDIGAYEACVSTDPLGIDPGCLRLENAPPLVTAHLTTQVSPAGAGTIVPPSGEYTLNSVLVLTATPNAGYSFANWTGNVGDPSNPSTTVTMDAPKSVTANFTSWLARLTGRGTPGNTLAASRVDLTWATLGAHHYTVWRASLSNGPYTLLGPSMVTAFSDTAGLTNGATYYYQIRAMDAAETEVGRSSVALVRVPNPR